MRNLRVSELLHQKLATLISEVRDPRIGMVTIYQVLMSPDLKNAKVYVSVFEPEKVNVSIDILNNAANFFRRELRGFLSLKYIPKLKFYFDHSSHQAAKIDRILAGI